MTRLSLFVIFEKSALKSAQTTLWKFKVNKASRDSKSLLIYEVYVNNS